MREITELLRALADDNRARIVLALRGQPLCVCQIVELVQLATSTVSEHLMILKKAGVVTARKEGRWVYYRLADKGASIAAREATSLLVRLLDASPGAKKDAGRLKGILRIDAEELCKRQKAEGAKCCGRVNGEKVLLQ
jgi:DNA-binding transcriptional ArsR family regulator